MRHPHPAKPGSGSHLEFSQLSSGINPKSNARMFAVQFLYQCEQERIFYFSEPHLEQFCAHHNIAPELAKWLEDMTAGTLQHIDKIDKTIGLAAKNWTLDRIAATDRAVLRLGTFELLESDTPTKVVLNEAIELAKKFGNENSSSFVNGVLDRIVNQTRD